MTEEQKPLTPIEIFNKNNEKAFPFVVDTRLQTCYGCEQFRKQTDQCMVCGCGMTIKAKLKDATCPLNYWRTPALPFDKELSEEEIEEIMRLKD
jgi:hypothetical protein